METPRRGISLYCQVSFNRNNTSMKQLLFLFLLPLFSLSQTLEPNSTYIISSGSSEGYDRPRVVITANNNPFIIWSKITNPKAIKAKKWNGSDFGSILDLVSADLMPTGFIGPEIASKGDTVYLIFESLLHANHIIYMKKSFDGGLTFSFDSLVVVIDL